MRIILKDNILVWAGSKKQLAEFIIEKMPPHKHYIEPFCGALNMFLAKSPVAERNTLNDINSNLVNFWKVIQDEGAKQLLIDRVAHLFHSRDLFNEFFTLYRSGYFKYLDGIYKAAIFLYLNRVSFGGKMDSYSPQSSSSALDIQKLNEIGTRIFRKLNCNNVVVENKHFLEIIVPKKIDDKDTFIYCDPPYMTTLEKGKMKYEFIMSKEEHIALRDTLYKLGETKWLISYDDNPIVRELYSDAKCIIETPKINWSLGNKDSQETKIGEILIANYNLNTANTFFEETKE